MVFFKGGSRYVPGSESGTSQSGGADPFTGAGRYIPGSATNDIGGSGGADPFTGGGRYVPTYSDNQRSTGSGAGGGDSKSSDIFTGNIFYCSLQVKIEKRESSIS